MVDLHEWDKVGAGMFRCAVPGGWLYQSEGETGVALAFVPAAPGAVHAVSAAPVPDGGMLRARALQALARLDDAMTKANRYRVPGGVAREAMSLLREGLGLPPGGKP